MLATLVTLFCVFKEQIAKKVLSEEEYLLLCFYQDTQQILEVSDYDYEINEIVATNYTFERLDDPFCDLNIPQPFIDNKIQGYNFYVLYTTSSADSENKSYFQQTFYSLYNSSASPYLVYPLSFDTSEDNIREYWIQNRNLYLFREGFIELYLDVYPTLLTNPLDLSPEMIENCFKDKVEMINTIKIKRMNKIPLKIKIFA